MAEDAVVADVAGGDRREHVGRDGSMVRLVLGDPRRIEPDHLAMSIHQAILTAHSTLGNRGRIGPTRLSEVWASRVSSSSFVPPSPNRFVAR